MSSDNVQTTPFSQSMNRFAEQKAQMEIQSTGRSLPASVVKVMGSIVEVKFEVQDPVYTLVNVTMPLFGPEYIRYPIQVGDKGFVVSADAYLGGMSGLGGGVANLTPRGNLTCLVFFPIGNKNWPPADDSNAVTIYGPDGVALMDVNKKSKVVVLPDSITLSTQDSKVTMTSGNINLTAGGHTVLINSTGVTIDGRVFLLHVHLDETSTTGPVA